MTRQQMRMITMHQLKAPGETGEQESYFPNGLEQPKGLWEMDPEVKREMWVLCAIELTKEQDATGLVKHYNAANKPGRLFDTEIANLLSSVGEGGNPEIARAVLASPLMCGNSLSISDFKRCSTFNIREWGAGFYPDLEFSSPSYLHTHDVIAHPVLMAVVRNNMPLTRILLQDRLTCEFLRKNSKHFLDDLEDIKSLVIDGKRFSDNQCARCLTEILKGAPVLNAMKKLCLGRMLQENLLCYDVLENVTAHLEYFWTELARFQRELISNQVLEALTGPQSKSFFEQTPRFDFGLPPPMFAQLQHLASYLPQGEARDHIQNFFAFNTTLVNLRTLTESNLKEIHGLIPYGLRIKVVKCLKKKLSTTNAEGWAPRMYGRSRSSDEDGDGPVPRTLVFLSVTCLPGGLYALLTLFCLYKITLVFLYMVDACTNWLDPPRAQGGGRYHYRNKYLALRY